MSTFGRAANQAAKLKRDRQKTVAPGDAVINTARRQCQAAQLAKCGARGVLEALLAVENGQALDEVLADFTRLPPELHHATIYFADALSDDGGAR